MVNIEVLDRHKEVLESMDDVLKKRSQRNQTVNDAYKQELEKIKTYDVESDQQEQQLDPTKALDALARQAQINEQARGEVIDSVGKVIAELESITTEADTLNRFEGLLEKGLGALTLTRPLANRMQLRRVRSSTISDSLETFTNYGILTVDRLTQMYADTLDCRDALQSDYIESEKMLRVLEPAYEEKRTERESLERQLVDLEEKLAIASPDERTTLRTEKTDLVQKVDEVKALENKYHNKVKILRELYGEQEKHMRGYNEQLSAIELQRDRLNEQVKGARNIFNSLDQSVANVLNMKAAERVDKTYKKAMEVSGRVLVTSTASMKKSAADAIERPIIDPAVQEWQNKYMDEQNKAFDQRLEASKAQYAKPGGR
ncbi:hypothetical protein H6503_06980 [Candidatus Woesearchaeota archaeon]|nr:hypothetical protein [Candidatus Woesearchaeota archaeon]